MKSSYSQNRKKSLVVDLDGEGKLNAQALIANLIVTQAEADKGMLSRVEAQGKFRLKPEMLSPTQMGFERTVLRTIYSLHAQKMPATFDNVLQRLKIEIDDAETKLTALSYHRTEPPQVERIAFALGDWIERQAMIVAARQVVERLQSPEGNTREAYQDAMQIMTTVAPLNTDLTERSADDMANQWSKNEKERMSKLKNSKPLGLTWPWKGLSKKVPHLKKGEMCTWLAKTKHGKTSIGLKLAEHYAHECGYDVAFFHLETSAISLMDRIVSRRLTVQSGALRVPEVFNIDAEPYKSAYKKLEAEYTNQDNGQITFIHCPGIGYVELEAKVAQYNALAQGRGRELAVIVDYHSEIDWRELAKDETAGLNAGASFLKNMAEAQGIYLIVFAQFGVDVDYGAKKAGWGSSKIVTRAQVVIRVEREDATDTHPFPDGAKKDASGQPLQKKDLVGVPMFYHEAGQPSSDAYFNVILANDDSIGPVPVKFINAYYEILDHPNEKAMLDLYFSGKSAKGAAKKQ